MIYAASITVPANTPITSIQTQVIQVTSGLVYHFELYYPPGSAGLLRLAVFDGLYQVWPSTPGEFFIGDNVLLRYDDIYLKEIEPFEFTLAAYNLDDTYEHTVQVRIGMVSKTIFMARFLPHLSYEFYKEVLAELQEKQETEAKEQLETPFPWVVK